MNYVQKTKGAIPSFTVIIPVVHSLEDLERCLSSLDSLDYPQKHFHVVMVDCHVLKGLKHFFAEKLPKYGLQASALCLPERPLRCPGPSWLIESRISEARNYAIRRVPGRCYVFTEDDCTFEPNWLRKFEAALTDGVGALGGPDILPEGLGWFPRALDCLLNSYLGTAGMRKGNGLQSEQYYPRKENMAIPANVLDRIGNFPEERPIGGEMEMAGRIRNAGLRIKFLADNPVWHRRVTNFRNFVRLTAYMASEKVRLMRQQRAFILSPHFLVLLATIVSIIIGVLSLGSSHAQILLAALTGAYFIALISTAISSAIRTCSVSVGIGLLLLMPAHHLSLIIGIINGTVTKTKSN